MSNAAGVRPITPIDSYTRKLLQDFEAAVFARAVAMSSETTEDSDATTYTEANNAYRSSKAALIRRISKLTATPFLDQLTEPETE
jgi:hypothetical protein